MLTSMTALLLVVYLINLSIGFWLKYLNLTYLKRHTESVPPEFEGAVDHGLVQKISQYTFENSRVNMVESAIGNIFLLLVFFGGLLGVYDNWVTSMTGSFIGRGVLFFLLLLFVETLLGMPFSLYRNFKVESRYGFNTMPLGLWISDLVKSFAISSILGAIVIVSALSIVRSNPNWWWLWVWAFFLVFSLFMMYIAPYVIEPLFFKFGPIKTEGLEEKVRLLMERAGVRVSRVFQVDASRRSRHSNAYFTGIGKVKRIVLFDTLIEQMSQDEILAVLAHEVGHWKKRHVLKRIILTEILALAGVFIAYRLLQWDGLPALIGSSPLSFYAKAVVVGFLGSLIMFPLTPLFNFLSRRDEREADRFASDLTGHPEALADALIKLSRENLSNLHPHPLYAKFHYSHPPVVERIRGLRGRQAENKGRSTRRHV
ncbi:MAG TPA: M48 family metallopeptidase [Nitrospirota bacterium]|nr:M48 family metallopeptidase [Nitrospirota bacterium]